MSRFGTEVEVESGVAHTRLTAFFFDCLHLDGEELLDQPLRVRQQALDRAVPAEWRIPHLATASVEEGTRFLAEAMAAGHEGVMVKDLDSTYQAGRRGAGWVKIKPAHTVDLVVLAVEWGHGRRQGWLSNLHLGARDPGGGFVIVGKTFKGMTDQMLAWQTQRFLELETRRDGHVVHLRPEQVVEVAFDGVQTSRRYPGGVALRFARVKGYRSDKTADEADTIETLRAIRDRQ
jgi:DNA ligase-1